MAWAMRADAGGEAAGRHRLDSRNQVGRVSHLNLPRARECRDQDQARVRLDRSISAIARAVAVLGARSAIIDGEAVVLDQTGKSRFADLQAALTRSGAEAAILYAFDLLFLDGADLRMKPLALRRAELKKLLKPQLAILLSDDFGGSGAAFFETACKHELEGIV